MSSLQSHGKAGLPGFNLLCAGIVQDGINGSGVKPNTWLCLRPGTCR